MIVFGSKNAAIDITIALTISDNFKNNLISIIDKENSVDDKLDFKDKVTQILLIMLKNYMKMKKLL